MLNWVGDNQPMKMREPSRDVDKKLHDNNNWLDESRLLKTDIINSIFKPFLNVVRSPGFLKKPEYADKKEKYLEENKEIYMTSCGRYCPSS